MDSDSDFYGDEDEVAYWTSKVNAYDVDAYWKDRGALGTATAQRQQTTQPASTALHNPYAGVPSAWQLTETLDEFFARMPPATTDANMDKGLAWIWICNPYIPRKPKTESSNQKIRGCEDEAPEEAGSSLELFCQGGAERLNMLTDFMDHARNSGGAKMVITREVNKARDEAVRDIYALAQHARVRPGKWMLFIEPSNVNAIWETVARATANNELGIGAKVAPREVADVKRARLICIYTYDFADKDDIGRVLNRLKQLELVRTTGRQIYYKADAFTYLGINSQNSWNIRASLYGSNDIFGYMKDKEA